MEQKAENTKPQDQVEDKDLASAWDEAQEEEPGLDGSEEKAGEEQSQSGEETPQDGLNPEDSEEPEEPTDNRERSRMGRKMKKMEDTLNLILEHLKTPPQTTAPEPQYVPPAAEEQIPEYITTPAELERYMKIRQNQQQQFQKKYEAGYLQQVASLKTKNTDLHDEIFDEMVKNFNVKHSGNPLVDARLNYAEAKASLLAKKTSASAPKPHLKGDKATGAGTNLTNKSQPQKASTPELDEFARDFIKSQGMSTEDVNEALSGSIPSYLRKAK